MTARAFLVRGLLAGLFAGIAAFAVGYFVAEPQIQTAINYEESHEDAPATHSTPVTPEPRRGTTTTRAAPSSPATTSGPGAC